MRKLIENEEYGQGGELKLESAAVKYLLLLMSVVCTKHVQYVLSVLYCDSVKAKQGFLM